MIPLDIYMTWKTSKLPPLMQENMDILKKTNPQFKFHLYNDNECREFIKTYFNPEVVNTFDTLIPGAYKADLWRLCILFIKGGIYMDIKFKTVNFSLIDLTLSDHFAVDRPTNSLHIYNAIMVCNAGHLFLRDCINRIVSVVKFRLYGRTPLSPTGPELLGTASANYKLTLDLKYPRGAQYQDTVMYKDKVILTHYKGYRKEQSAQSGLHYWTLWERRKIYR